MSKCDLRQQLHIKQERGHELMSKRKMIYLTVLAVLILSFSSYAADVGHITSPSTTVSRDMEHPDEILQNILQNTAVAVLGGTTAEDGSTWYHVVTLEGNEGYIRASDMTLGAPTSSQAVQQTEQIQEPDANDGAADPENEDLQNGNTDNPEQDDQDTEQENTEIEAADFYVEVIEKGNIRADATTDSEGLSSVEQGTVLHVTGQETDEQGTLWYRVEYGEDQTGYIFSELVQETEPPEGENTETEESTMEINTMPSYDHSGSSQLPPVQSNSAASQVTASTDQMQEADVYREATGKKGFPFDFTILILLVAAVFFTVVIIKTHGKLKHLSNETDNVK